VPPQLLRAGRNRIAIRLNKRGPGLGKPLRVRRIELICRAVAPTRESRV
jgi:hypothetical protein